MWRFVMSVVLCTITMVIGHRFGEKSVREEALLVGTGDYRDDEKFFWRNGDEALTCFWDHYALFARRLFCEDQDGTLFQYGMVAGRQKVPAELWKNR